jgi:hypothetical protein
MVRSQHREEEAYVAVLMGELSIDQEGRIWRLGSRRGNRWTGGSDFHPLTVPRRAENPTGDYLQVRVMINGVRHHALAHRLVWRHANGPIPGELTVNHKNGMGTDNRLSNLELATHAEQTKHAREVLGKIREQHGVLNSHAKLTTAEVLEIRARRAAGEKLAAIAADYDVAMQTVSKIARGTLRSLG